MRVSDTIATWSALIQIAICASTEADATKGASELLDRVTQNLGGIKVLNAIQGLEISSE